MSLLRTAIKVAMLLVWVEAAPRWYTQERRQFLLKERNQATGAMLTLTPEEEAVNRIIMEAKRAEIQSAIYNSTTFLPSLHFFQSQPLMAKSKVFQIIEKMPKGASLHSHLGATTSIDWLVKNVTYRPLCYMCVSKDRIIKTGFFLTPPHDNDCTWLEIARERTKASDTDAFDQSIYDNLTIIVDNPEVKYPDINAVWARFVDYFDSSWGLITYTPVLRDYMYQTLKEFRQDNVQYMETRISRFKPYELNGTTHDLQWVVRMLSDVVKEFKHDFPDFSGAKFIFAGPKESSVNDILNDVKESINLRRIFPDIFLGFDLGEQEDVYPTIHHFINDLLYPKSHNQPLPYFFHAGETDWHDIHDNNLIDAILLNTSRIGHGFAITKHPEVMRLVKERNIPVEVNPVSNQVLKLVADLRNHPGSILLSQDFPVCISSDDPAPWGALPASHDYYVTFMALAAADDDLRLLKQLTMSSINFSAMTDQEKSVALQLWRTKWHEFLEHVKTTHGHAHIIGK